jgi:hypothetical protein
MIADREEWRLQDWRGNTAPSQRIVAVCKCTVVGFDGTQESLGFKTQDRASAGMSFAFRNAG